MPAVYFEAMDLCVKFGRNYGTCFKDICSFHCAFLVWIVYAHPDICRDLLNLAPDLPLPVKNRKRSSVVEGHSRGKRGCNVFGHVSKQLMPLFYLAIFLFVAGGSLALVGKHCVLVAPAFLVLPFRYVLQVIESDNFGAIPLGSTQKIALVLQLNKYIPWFACAGKKKKKCGSSSIWCY